MKNKLNNLVDNAHKPDNLENTSESIRGTIQRVTFHNNESGFSVLKVAVHRHKDLVAVIGVCGQAYEGEPIQAIGHWENNSTHGLQFKATSIKTFAPSTEEGIERYLGSGMIKGIGPSFAKRLVAAFGTKVLEVIDQTPEKLNRVPGMGAQKIKAILASWKDQKSIRDIMVFLQSYGISTARAKRIYLQYGIKAIAKIQENPYCLAADIHGIGFKTADGMAMRMGVSPDSILRARAGLNYTLLESLSNGHCGLAQEKLISEAEKLLSIPDIILREALVLELEAKRLVADTLIAIPDTIFIYMKYLWQYEKNIAIKLQALGKSSPLWADINITTAIPWVEKKLNIQLSKGQQQALYQLVRTKLMVITGGPGVGKTSLVKSVLEVLKRKDLKILLAAPTGKAAKRLNESTGMPAKTIHRLLETEGKNNGFMRNADNPLDCDLLIIDETSMVDVPLMRALCDALPESAGLILVGDVDQLPSVGPGQVLKDIIDSEVVPVVILTQIFRQAASSQIIVNAHKVNQGHMPELTHRAPVESEDGVDNKPSDFYFIEASTPEEAVQKILHVVSMRIPARFGFNALSDIQVLCPMNKGAIGAQSLNLSLQAVLNPALNKNSIERLGTKFSVGDKIIQTENNYDKLVFNGDSGYITVIDLEEKQVMINFDQEEKVYDYDELDQIALAYALTIHKSQGSEYPVVVMPLMMQHFMMLKRNLLYTGMTRGKKLVILVGEKRAIGMAIQAREQHQRISKLKEWLQQESVVS